MRTFVRLTVDFTGGGTLEEISHFPSTRCRMQGSGHHSCVFVSERSSGRGISVPGCLEFDSSGNFRIFLLRRCLQCVYCGDDALFLFCTGSLYQSADTAVSAGFLESTVFCFCPFGSCNVRGQCRMAGGRSSHVCRDPVHAGSVLVLAAPCWRQRL